MVAKVAILTEARAATPMVAKVAILTEARTATPMVAKVVKAIQAVNQGLMAAPNRPAPI